MWKNLLLNSISVIVKRLIGSGLFEAIEKLVLSATNTELSGDAKRTEVQTQVNDLKGIIGVAARSTSGVLINLAIEAIVAKYKLGDNK